MKIKLCLLILLLILMSNLAFASENANYEIDNILLKIVVKQGEDSYRFLKISNTGIVKEKFELNFSSDMVFINESVFEIDSGEAKSLRVGFKSKEKEPGIYLGKILISNGKKQTKIPVILEIESKEVLFDNNINVRLENSRTYPGEKLVVENKIYNLENIGAKNIEVFYLIKNFDEKTVFIDQENMAVESQASTVKTVSIPEDISAGDYVFMVTVKYGDSTGTSSYFFQIFNKPKKSIKDIFDEYFYVFVLIILAVVFCFIFMFFYYIKKREDVFIELEKQYRINLKRESEELERKRERIEGLKTPERKKKLKELKKERKIRKKAIKAIYKTRIKTLKTLKKQNKKNEIEMKLKEWEKEGYNMKEFLIKDKKKEDVEKTARRFKKQGFKY